MDKITTGNKYNALYIIQSLNGNECNIGNALYKYFSQNPIKGIALFHPKKVRNNLEFRNALKVVLDECRSGCYPIIHIDMHGNKINGLWNVSSRTFMSWVDFQNICREINIECANNLTVTMSSCEGFYAVKGFNIDKPSPFSMLLAPQKKIYDRDAATLCKFYKNLLGNNNFEEAYGKTHPLFRAYSAEISLIEILINSYSSSRKQKRYRIGSIISGHMLGRVLSNDEVNHLKYCLKKNIDTPTLEEIIRHCCTFLLLNDPRNWRRYDLNLIQKLISQKRPKGKLLIIDTGRRSNKI